MDGHDWFTILIGATCLAYAIGYGASAIIKASKAKAVCSECDDEIDE